MAQASSKCPEHRHLHNSAIIGREMLVWGGRDENHRYFSHEVVWGLDLAEKSWSKRTAKFEGKDDLPRPSHASTIAVIGNRDVYQFGGACNESFSWEWFNDLHMLERQNLKWKRILPKKGPIPDERSECGMCFLGDELVMFGGWANFTLKSDVWLFSLTNGVWSLVESKGKTPASRCGHSLTAMDEHQAVLIGGWWGSKVCDDCFIFSINSKEWTEISSSFGPHKLSPRCHHSAICVDVVGQGLCLFVLWGRSKHPGILFPNAELIDLSTMKCTDINLPDAPLSQWQTVCSLSLKNGKLGFIRFGGVDGNFKSSVLIDALEWDPQLKQFSRININNVTIQTSEEATFRNLYIERDEFHFEEEERNFLAGGGCAEVYRGTMKSGEAIAVKIFLQRRRSPHESLLLKKEAQILFGIKSHPNIVKFIGICDSPRCYALLMEFVSGGDLDQLLASSDPEVEKWSNRVDISLQVATGMAHLHGNNPAVIHLDLKPKNILIQCVPRESGNPFICKICDFGLAKMSEISAVTTHRPEGSIPKGTIAYIAPERYEAYGPGSKEEKEEIAKKSDVFSYGVLLWQIRERKYPYEDAIANKIRKGERLPEGPSPAPDGYNELIIRCSAFDPKERWSFPTVIEYLDKIHGQMS